MSFLHFEAQGYYTDIFYDFHMNSIEILRYCKFVMLDQNEQGKLKIR